MKEGRIGRRELLQAAAKGAASVVLGQKILKAEPSNMSFSSESPKEYTVACYYFPNYHVDKRNEREHGKGWTEWELMKNVRPMFKGHYQPRVPLWGYEDESDPAVMAKKIDAAASHGIDAFIFDWYWYDDRPFIERCLEEGFLKANNYNKMKFGIMWANHDWSNVHPAKRRDPKITLYKGAVTRKTFDTIVEYVIEKYFKHPSYWCVEGKPFFSIYSLPDLIKGLGGIEQAKEALANFRAKTKAAGFSDLHLNAALPRRVMLAGSNEPVKDINKFFKEMGCASVNSYHWFVTEPMDKFPTVEYNFVRDRYIRYLKNIDKILPDVAYLPTAIMGWDSTPRCLQSDIFPQDNEDFKDTGRSKAFPWWPVVVNNTPEAFREAMEIIKNINDGRDVPKIFILECWNEWTEGSYLEPDKVYGMGYLEAVKKIFGDK